MNTPIHAVQLVKDGSVRYAVGRGGKFANSATAAAALRNVIGDAPTEEFWVAVLDARNRPITFAQISKGTLTQSLVHPREVFLPIILSGGAAFMVFHNHPSGSPDPSHEDAQVTKRLVEAAEILSVPMLDHIIVTATGYSSWADGDTKWEK